MAKSNPDNSLESLGPPAWANWQRFIQNDAAFETYTTIETNLYSDTRLVGDLMPLKGWAGSKDTGPYRVLYAFCDGEGVLDGAMHPRYILRAALVPPQPQTVEGMNLEQEIAALLSLETGARIVTGSRTRYTGPDFPPGGRPHGEQQHPGQLPRRSSSYWLVPGFEKLQGAQDCIQFVTYPKLTKTHAATLTRAALSFSSALWICESQPELAWLLLVSAIECVSSLLPTLAPDAVFDFPTELASVANALPNEQKEILSAYLQERSLAKRKFLALLERNLPPEPRQLLHNKLTRPSEGILEWNWSNLLPLAKRIYDMRSKRLHAGVHFPAWTCAQPKSVSGNKELLWEYVPRPKMVKDAGKPDFTLNTFAYIMRKAILNWWRSVVPGPVEEDKSVPNQAAKH